MKRAAAVLALLIVGLDPVPSLAVTQHSVAVKNVDFSPAIISISAGDSVRWTNLDNFNHTVTSTRGFWDSGNFGLNSTYTLPFPHTGIFDYFCKLHPSMTGVVKVGQQGNPPPEPVTVFTARPGTTIGSVRLDWAPPSDTGGIPVPWYDLCVTNSAMTTPSCRLISHVTHLDVGRVPLQTQYYTIRPISGWGDGPISATICSKPYPWIAELGC